MDLSHYRPSVEHALMNQVAIRRFWRWRSSRGAHRGAGEAGLPRAEFRHLQGNIPSAQ